MTMQTPPTPTALQLTDEIKSVVNGALTNGTPFVVAYVDVNGQPSLSLRGSTQAYSDDQLAIWIRNPEGGLLNSLEKNPRVTLFYRDSATRTTLQFRGRAHVENSPPVREHVYNSAPEQERNADKEQKGIPLIIDLDRVDGVIPGTRIMMRRDL
jgi:hypothetical protein